MKLSDIIVHEDEALIVINKPAGLVVHPDGRNDFETLSEIILEDYPQMKYVGEPLTLEDGSIIMRPGIVHRLDKDTSGVMLLAKTQDVYHDLKNQFQKHIVKKHYTAIVFGSFRHARGQVDQVIGRSNQDIRKWAAGVHARGEKRESLTLYSVKESFKINSQDGQPCSLSITDIYPQTGRTHQIRVHMQYIQHPVIGDDLYADYLPKFTGVNRQMLHASDITIVHPLTNKKVNFSVPLANDMQEFINELLNIKNGTDE